MATSTLAAEVDQVLRSCRRMARGEGSRLPPTSGVERHEGGGPHLDQLGVGRKHGF
jgi:hypothetical protein